MSNSIYIKSEKIVTLRYESNLRIEDKLHVIMFTLH